MKSITAIATMVIILIMPFIIISLNESRGSPQFGGEWLLPLVPYIIQKSLDFFIDFFELK